jgi:hypothetical protein
MANLSSIKQKNSWTRRINGPSGGTTSCRQGCQIFLRQTNQNGKKCNKTTDSHKMYQNGDQKVPNGMKYTNLFQPQSFQNRPKKAFLV